MRLKLLIVCSMFFFLATAATVSAHHDTYYTHHNSYNQYDHRSPNYWYDDSREVRVYRHYSTNYFVPAPRGYPHTQHSRNYRTYQSYNYDRYYDHCYRSGSRWRCR